MISEEPLPGRGGVLTCDRSSCRAENLEASPPVRPSSPPPPGSVAAATGRGQLKQIRCRCRAADKPEACGLPRSFFPPRGQTFLGRAGSPLRHPGERAAPAQGGGEGRGRRKRTNRLASSSPPPRPTQEAPPPPPIREGG